MAKTSTPDELGRRERQIMDVVHRLGEASVAEVREALPDPPTYSAVRAMLRWLEDKGYLTHVADGLRYKYRPTVSPATARRTALRYLIHTFFEGSASKAAASLLELPDAKISAADAARLTELIKKARSEER